MDEDGILKVKVFYLRLIKEALSNEYLRESCSITSAFLTSAIDGGE
jgi:hypothetical protein